MINKNAVYTLLVITLSLTTSLAFGDKTQASSNCSDIIAADTTNTQVLAAADKFNEFFNEIKTQLLERDYFLNVAKLAILAKEHVLMFGPPGNAKSMGVDLIIDNVVDDTGNTSVFKIQMTPETSLSETHGTIDYNKIMTDNIQTRQWEQGILSAKFVFFDEFFDARANAIRNNLMALNEREHAQGRERIKGETETGFAATNKYSNEIYEKAGDDGPKAIIDRFAFTVFVPSQVDNINSALQLITESAQKKINPITFAELDELRAKVDEVTIPQHVAKMMTLLFYKMKEQTEALEESEKKHYSEQKRMGQNPSPPYRATKFYSPRTLRKAGKILRSMVVLDWIESDRTRPLIANPNDLQKLVQFFTLNSADTDFLTRLEEATINPYEKVQLMTALKERQLFNDIFHLMMTEINESVAALTDLEIARETAKTPELREQFEAKIVAAYMNNLENSQNAEKITDLTAVSIGANYAIEVLADWMKELWGEKSSEILAAKMADVKVQQAAAAEAEKRQIQQQRLKEEQLKKNTAPQPKSAPKPPPQELQDQFLKTQLLYSSVDNFSFSKRLFVGDSPAISHLYNSNPNKFTMLYISNSGGQVSETDLQRPNENLETVRRRRIGWLEAISYTVGNALKEGRASLHGMNYLTYINTTPRQIVSIGNNRVFLWFGEHGQVLDTSVKGIKFKKNIYSEAPGQYLADNSSEGKIALISPSESKIGIIDANLVLTQWHDLSEYTLESRVTKTFTLPQVLTLLSHHYHHHSQQVFDAKTNVIYFRILPELGGAYTTISVHLDAKKIIVEDVLESSPSPTSLPLNALHKGPLLHMSNAFADSHRIRYLDYNPLTEELRVVNHLIGEKKTYGPTKVKVESAVLDGLHGFLFDISPDGTTVLFVDAFGKVNGLDMNTGQVFSIPISGAQNIRFIDDSSILVLKQDNNCQVVKLPTTH